jgi:hypothetical protein
MNPKAHWCVIKNLLREDRDRHGWVLWYIFL